MDEFNENGRTIYYGKLRYPAAHDQKPQTIDGLANWTKKDYTALVCYWTISIDWRIQHETAKRNLARKIA